MTYSSGNLEEYSVFRNTARQLLRSSSAGLVHQNVKYTEYDTGCLPRDILWGSTVQLFHCLDFNAEIKTNILLTLAEVISCSTTWKEVKQWLWKGCFTEAEIMNLHVAAVSDKLVRDLAASLFKTSLYFQSHSTTMTFPALHQWWWKNEKKGRKVL